MQDQVVVSEEVKIVPVSSEQIKSVPIEKEASSQNISLKIWSEITSSRIKEVKQVIEIIEQKVPNDLSSTNEQQLQKRSVSQSHIQDPSKQSDQTNQKSLQTTILQKQTLKRQDISIKEKDQYINRQLFVNNLSSFQYSKQFKENQRIHSIKMDQFFGTENLSEGKDYFKEVQLKAVDWIMNFYVKVQGKPQQCNLIRTIDLLYKKYIIKSFKSSQQQILEQKNLFSDDIYQPDPIYGERFHSLKDDSISSNLQTSQSSDSNSLKRSAAGKNYGENFVSLIENQSTTENQDYLQAIASNYVNGIRKQKYSDGPVRNNQIPNQTPKPSIQPNLPNQASDKFKKYGQSSSQIQLPFDIDLSNHSTRRQNHQQYNIFQGPDDQKSERFTQQKLVAKTFVKEGYGLQIVRNYMGPSMDGGSYNRAITTIIRQSYKRIEEFLLKTCNIKIHSLTSSEFSLVKTPLVHCRNILRPEDLRTFFKYVAITYKFGKLKPQDSPTAEQTLSLYNAILRGLSDRKTAKDSLHKPSSHKDLYYKS